MINHNQNGIVNITISKARKAQLLSMQIKNKKANIEAAKEVGALIAKRAIEKKIDTVVFDRGGYIYHGVVKELADAAREGGLVF